MHGRTMDLKSRDYCSTLCLCDYTYNYGYMRHIYYRFIVRFPIGLDFPFITLPFQGW